jgi:hypothetical protein
MKSIDGLLCEFFKAMWDTVGGNLCCMDSENLSSSNLTESLNQGIIKLIPKNVSHETIRG